ncbi:hypothetical protein ACJ2PR_15865 [Phormidesmis sp. 146-33]
MSDLRGSTQESAFRRSPDPHNFSPTLGLSASLLSTSNEKTPQFYGVFRESTLTEVN